MIQIGSMVKDTVSNKMATVLEKKITSDNISSSMKYLIEIQDGGHVWRSHEDLQECLTNEGKEFKGQFLTEG